MEDSEQPIKIVGDEVIGKPEHILDFVAVASWNKGRILINSMSVGEQGISSLDRFYLWVGLAADLLNSNPPPAIQKILITVLQSLDPNFTYASESRGYNPKKT